MSESPPDNPSKEISDASLLSFPGRLSLVDLSLKERENFLLFFSQIYNTHSFDFLSYFLPTTSLFQFLDVFAEDEIKLPSREDALKYVEFTQIYTYVSSLLTSPYPEGKALPEDIVTKSANRFNKRPAFIRSSYERVRKQLFPKQK